MYKLVPCCLLLTAFLNPLLSRPVRDSGAEPLLLSAPGEDARSTLDELEREFLRQVLPEMSGAEGGDGPRKADPSTNIVKAQGHVGKRCSQVFSQTGLSSQLRCNPCSHRTYLSPPSTSASFSAQQGEQQCWLPGFSRALNEVTGGTRVVSINKHVASFSSWYCYCCFVIERCKLFERCNIVKALLASGSCSIFNFETLLLPVTQTL
nr:urotensin-2 isoform X1 [Equus asinus]